MPSVQKICVGCNTDVGNKKRVKDTQGNYYCQSCYEAKLSGKMSPARVAEPEPVAAGAGADAPDPYDFPPEPQDIGEIGFAETPEELAPEPMAADMFGCADCKKLVPSSQIRNDDGEFVCARCHAKRRGTIRGAATPRNLVQTDDAPAKSGFADSIVGGLVLTPAVLAGSFLFFFLLNFVMPIVIPGVPRDASPAAGALIASAYTGITFGTAFFLVISLLIARACGAASLANFGGTLWKTFALSAVITIIIRFVDQLELVGVPFVGIIMLIARYYILRGGIQAIFNVEILPARVIAILNVFIEWGVRVVGYVVIGAGLMAIHIARDGLPVRPGFGARPAIVQPGDAPADKNAAPADDNAAPAPAADNAQPPADNAPAPAPAPPAN